MKVGSRILVALGPAPGSAYLVRWASEAALALGAEWTALHVETGAKLGQRDRARLEENLRLARELGAEVVVVSGGDLAASVVAMARAKGASMIVVGRSGLSRAGFAPRRATVSDRIVRESAPIDIAVVQDSSALAAEPPFAALKRLFGAPRSQLLALAATFFVLIGSGELLAPLVGYRSVALIFIAAVLGLSFLASPGPVAVLAALSALALNFFFIPPLYTLSIHRAEDWILFGIYFLVAFSASALVSRSRAKDRLLRDREESASFLFGAARLLSDSASVEAALQSASRLVEEHFSSRSAVFADDERGGLDPRPLGAAAAIVDERELEAARRALETGEICGARSPAAPAARLRYVPASAGGRARGAIGIEAPKGKGWTRSGDNLLLSMGRTLALAIERCRSEERSREASLRLESERLGRILLDSVSHELRTPLTTITGSLSALRDDGLAERAEARRELLANALEAADRLDEVVEDLLSLSRIESGMLRLARVQIDLPELARAALRRAGPELGPFRVEVSAPEDRGPAFVDVALAARLAANLLRNAARYSPREEPISLALEPREGELALRVRDRGPGLPESELAAVFTKFARGRGARGGGLGLGLAICRGLAEVHGGRIAAHNAPGGGLEVEAVLPYGDEGANG